MEATKYIVELTFTSSNGILSVASAARDKSYKFTSDGVYVSTHYLGEAETDGGVIAVESEPQYRDLQLVEIIIGDEFFLARRSTAGLCELSVRIGGIMIILEAFAGEIWYTIPRDDCDEKLPEWVTNLLADLSVLYNFIAEACLA